MFFENSVCPILKLIFCRCSSFRLVKDDKIFRFIFNSISIIVNNNNKSRSLIIINSFEKEYLFMPFFIFLRLGYLTTTASSVGCFSQGTWKTALNLIKQKYPKTFFMLLIRNAPNIRYSVFSAILLNIKIFGITEYLKTPFKKTFPKDLHNLNFQSSINTDFYSKNERSLSMLCMSVCLRAVSEKNGCTQSYKIWQKATYNCSYAPESQFFD